MSQKILKKTRAMSLTKNPGSAAGAARKILQRGRKVTIHGTDHPIAVTLSWLESAYLVFKPLFSAGDFDL